MRHKLIYKIYAFLIILVTVFIPTLVFAQDASFSLIPSASQIKVGDKVNILIQANNVQNVYGYELTINYDSTKLRLEEVKGEMNGYGFTTGIKDGEFRYVYTQKGKDTPELNGNLALCNVIFSAKNTGDADVILKSVEIADKNLNSQEYSPESEAIIKIISAESGRTGGGGGGGGGGATQPIQPTQPQETEQIEQPQIETKTDVGSINVSSNILNADELKGVKHVLLSIVKLDASELAPQIKAEIADRPVIDVIFEFDGRKVLWNNPDVPIIVSIPYSPSTDEYADPEHIVVWYIDSSGKQLPVPNGKYDPSKGEITFTVTHSGRFAVAYVKKTFKDIENYPWAKKAIEVMASKGVINGTSATTYTPDAPIKRADFMLLLVKALGLSAKVDNNFSDVSPTAYYYEALGIAKKLGIAQGMGDNKFNPESVISRQDMMVLIDRAMRVAGKNLLDGADFDLSRFADKSKIASYAAQSIATLVKNGIVAGDGNFINPLGNATRAETAVLVYRVYNK